MREVIQQLLATEAEAKQKVKSAQAEADQIVAAAKKQSAELRDIAGQDALCEREQILSTATNKANEDKQARLTAIRAELEQHLQFDENVRQSWVDAVVRCIRGCG